MGISLGRGLRSGGGGAAGDALTTAVSFSALPASADLGAYARVGTTLYRYSEDNGWAPPAFYDAPALTEVLKLNVRYLSLADGASVASWGDLSQGAGSLQPTYNDSGGPADGPWVDFAGDRLTGATAALGGVRHVVIACVFRPDSNSNKAIFAIGNSVTVCQFTLFNGIRLTARTGELLGAGSAFVSSAGGDTSNWNVVVGRMDYTDAEALGLRGDTAETVRDVPVPLARAGVTSLSGLGTPGTIEAGSKGVTVGNNVSGSIAYDGGLAYLGVGTTASALTDPELDALGELAWMETTG